MDKISGFFGEYRFLSNFWQAKVILDGVTYPCVENAYQAAKTLDHEARRIFERCTAKDAKQFGKTVQLRPDWGMVKINIMLDLVTQKFSVDPLRRMLIATGSAQIIEENTWGDTFWGVCNGTGHNWMGRILTDIRERLQAEAPEDKGARLCIFGSRGFGNHAKDADLVSLNYAERNLVIAERNTADRLLCNSILDRLSLFKSGEIVEVVSGTASGADTLGEKWAAHHDIDIIRFPANWDLYGKSAGFRRNEEMAVYSTHAFGFWDGESKGTKGMIDLCKRMGITVAVYNITTGEVTVHNRKE